MEIGHAGRSWMAQELGIPKREGDKYFYVWIEDGEVVRTVPYHRYAVISDDEYDTVAGVLAGKDELDVWRYVHNNKTPPESA